MKKKCNLLWALLLALLLIALSGAAGADVAVWTGGDGNWSDSARWYSTDMSATGYLPADGDHAVIGRYGTDSTVYLDGDSAVLSSLKIESWDEILVLDQSSNTMRIETGGNLSISSNGSGQSTYTLSGGVLEMGETTQLTLDSTGDADQASFNLSGTGRLIKKSYEVKIGANGSGHFYQDGGTFELSGAMYVGDAGTGHYTMIGGEITGYDGTLEEERNDTDPNNDDPHMHYGGLVLGEWGGTGIFDQAGGMVTINNLSLARQESSTGTYYLNDAYLEVIGEAKIGEKGTGTFNQNGSSYFHADQVWVGVNAAGSGEYNLSSGELYTECLIIGGKDGEDEPGRGIFRQYGGRAEAGGLWIGDTLGSTGDYWMEGGELIATWYDVVGMRGLGIFIQENGTHTAAQGFLELGGETTGEGRYDLRGGDLYTKGTMVGSSGMGYFNQTGGIHSVDGELIVARFEGSRGTYVLSGDAELYTYRSIVGDAGFNSISMGDFRQSESSKHKVSQDLIIGQDPMSQGIYTLSDDAVLDVQGNIYLGDEGGTGTFTQSGNSELSVNDLHISSSSETGNAPGYGSFVMEGGTLYANAVYNGGLFTGVTGSGNISVANGFYNTGVVAPGQSPGTLTIDGYYIQESVGTLLIELGGYIPGTDSDLLKVTGNAHLDGGLEVSLWNGFTPSDGDTFDILKAGEVFGMFDKNSLIFPKGWSWQIAYLDLDENNTYDTVRLTANSVPVPAAVWLFASGLIGLVGLGRRKQE